MPLQPHNSQKSPIAVTRHYGQQQQQQRRRRFQPSYAAVSTRDVLDPARRRQRQPEFRPPWRMFDSYNNNNYANGGRSGQKRSYIGAMIYKTGQTGSDELAVHVFDGYQVKIRRVESESLSVERFSRKKPLTSHLSSNLLVVQKLVPVHYSTTAYFELDAEGNCNERYKVTLNFERKFVAKLVGSFEPPTRCIYSEAYFNVC